MEKVVPLHIRKGKLTNGSGEEVGVISYFSPQLARYVSGTEFSLDEYVH